MKESVVSQHQGTIIGQKVFVNLFWITCSQMTVWQVEKIVDDGYCPFSPWYRIFVRGSRKCGGGKRAVLRPNDRNS